MTLDQRIEKDLTELYEGKEITCAKELQSVLEVSANSIAFSRVSCAVAVG